MDQCWGQICSVGPGLFSRESSACMRRGARGGRRCSMHLQQGTACTPVVRVSTLHRAWSQAAGAQPSWPRDRRCTLSVGCASSTALKSSDRKRQNTRASFNFNKKSSYKKDPLFKGLTGKKLFK